MRYLTLAATCGLASCGSLLGLGDDGPLMLTDADTYQLVATARGVETTIGYTYSNRTGDAVSIPNCLGDVTPRLEKLVGGEWLVAWNAGSLECLSEPVTIEPDAKYRDEVRLAGGPRGGAFQPEFLIAPITGTYRLVWATAVWDYQPWLPWGEMLPLARRVSNRFELHEP